MSSFGAGGFRFGPGLPLSPMVKLLLMANVGIFVLALLPGVDAASLNREFGMVPNAVFAQGKVWQLVTYMFLHGGFLHIFFNMLILWMFGTIVEHQWGSRDFLVYYFACGVGGALLDWITGPGSPVATIGASGAIFGLLMAFTLMYPDREVLFWMILPIKMKYLMWGMLGLGLLLALTHRDAGVAHWAHLGGALTGWIYLKADWRWGVMGRKFRAARAKRVMQANAKRAQREQVSREEIDAILDKINAQGIGSLTERERRILDEASRR